MNLLALQTIFNTCTRFPQTLLETFIRKKGVLGCAKLYGNSNDENIRIVAGSTLLLIASTGTYMPSIVEQGGELLLRRLVIP